MNNVSPLRYPGGKTRACVKLDNILNKYFKIYDYKYIISPFYGGGSFEFYIQNKYDITIIANDKFKPLANFWNVCKNNNQSLCDELNKQLNTITKSTFIELRKNIIGQDNNLQQAIDYFIINRCSFSGATLSGGFSEEASKKRFTKSSIEKINNLDLSKFTNYNKDFSDFMDNILQDDDISNKSIIFLDPPYYLEKASKLYGNNGDMHEAFEHQQLYEYISKRKNWLITYNNCEYIKNLYKDFIIIDINWAYGMNKSKESTEIVIIGL